MIVTIESIDQRLKLDGSSELVTSLSLLLPNGMTVSAQVASEAAQTIINLVSDPEYVPETHTVTETPEASEGPVELYGNVRVEESPLDFDGDVFGGDVGEATEEPEQELISWRELPDTTLPSHVKLELEKAGVDDQLKVADLVELTETITERLMEQKRAQPQRVQGVVQRVQSPPIKTVPKDEMGYPRVTSVDRDPGEIAQMGTDEDGVPQL